MNKDKLIFVCHHGGGRHWLGNVIWHLENNDTLLPIEKLYFDKQPQGSIRFVTRFDYFEPNKITIHTQFDSPEYLKIVFFPSKPFNIYLNEGSKIHFNKEYYNRQTLPFADQLTVLTDNARGWLLDENFYKYYFDVVDLDHKTLFQTPKKFVDQLFNILDKTDLSYTKNTDYCLLSIENYKKTCIDPESIIGNMDSIYWLAWCHALKMIHKLPLTEFNFLAANSIDEYANALKPIQNQCIEITKELYFPWYE